MTLFSLAAMSATLALFVWIGLRARPSQANFDEFVSARNSQPATALGLSFLASGMGAWILFVPPEIGAFVGPIALSGYAIGAALPFFILIWFGPAIRQRMPLGCSLSEFAQERYGTTMRHWITFMSVLYMLCFITAELTAIGAITGILSDIPGNLVIIGLALTTLLYTAWGGLRASLATDRWQAVLLIALLVAVGFLGFAGLPEGPLPVEMPNAPVSVGLSVAVTLIIAVTAANLFHQGYWQRIWAAKSDDALRKGAWIGGATTIAVVVFVGAMGMLAVMASKDLGSPPAPFFALLRGVDTWISLPILVLALALVASSVDTLQSGLASLFSTYSAKKSFHSLAAARWTTVLLMIPVIAVALQGISVLRLFLIADLLCATAIAPILLSLWKHMTARAALAGCSAGIAGAIVPGWVESASLGMGIYAASFPDGIPTLAPFLGALTASTIASVGVSLVHQKSRSKQ